MSWGFSVPATPAADFSDAAGKARDEYRTQLADTDYDVTAEAAEQMAQAIAAAEAIVASGAVGTGSVQASLSGHANVGHAPTPGYANDAVSVNVSCADQYEPPQEPAPTA